MTTLLNTEKSHLKEYDFENHELLDNCVREIDDKLNINPKFKLFGKECTMHRAIAFFSNESKGYYYSKKLEKSKPLTTSLINLLQIINSIFNSDFNGILVNRYENGFDYISQHSDSEIGIASSIGVVALSYGATRTFKLVNKKTKEITKIPMEPYKILQMAGNFQEEFTHGIPIEKDVTGVRYSFTFRKHLE
tara:strand:+ start:1200 stop:1775 length:576 start_codon:yes stop_codon:yes gene_type:complete